MKQEDSIARLWSVSCELFLNCRLLSDLCRSKERCSDLSVSVSTKCVHVQMQYVHENIPVNNLLRLLVPTFLTGKSGLQLGHCAHIKMVTSYVLCPHRDLLRSNTARDDKKQITIIQLLQSKAVWNEP